MMYWRIVLIVSCLKLLFIPAYRSTDFEVHRNWLAITHSLPISKWYFENTSEWTLDYPPLFAWFEFVLSYIAVFFDREMLVVGNLNYASTATILFQRLSVIIADLVFAYGTKECCNYLSSCGVRKSSKWSSRWGSPTAILQLLLIGNAGLLIVDHIHFQYNGLLFGILLLSVARTMQEHWLEGAFWFVVLLNMKHIFAYVAPAYFVYFLRNYCFKRAVPGEPFRFNTFSFKRTAKLGAVVISVFIVSFGPFVALGQIEQVLTRLFPFKRGLCHAYWAPNIWAIYNVADKFLVQLGKFGGYNIQVNKGSMTGGLVQEFGHAVLTDITPKTTFIYTLVSVMPCLVKLWFSSGNPLHFMRSVIICASCSFLFGWHVHEKAILMIIIPLSVMAVVWKKEGEIFLMLSTVGHYSLFPLLFTPFEQILKVFILLIYSVYAFTNLSHLFDVKTAPFCLPLLSKLESLYILLFPILFIFESIIFPMTNLFKIYPFLPLMLTSVYCSVGVTYSCFRYYWHFLTISETDHKRKAY